MSVSKNIVSHDSTDYAWYSSSNMSNGYAGYDSTTYATIRMTEGRSAESYAYFIFGSFSEIPEGARITSVTCKAAAYSSNVNDARIATRTIQLYSGTTAKGTATTIGRTADTYTLDAGTWTRDELLNARIRIYGTRGTLSVTAAYYLYFGGATMTVDYTEGGTSYTMKVKSNGAWVDVTKVLAKDGGTWKEATKVLAKDNGTWK